MGNQHAWEQVRAKNPIVKRNAWVAYRGRNYRVASISPGGNVILRHQVTVHPTDIETPNLDARGKIYAQLIAHEAQLENLKAIAKTGAVDTLIQKDMATLSGIIQGLSLAMEQIGFALAA